MVARDTVMLLRRNDPLNECRQISLYGDADSWSVREVVRFLSNPYTMHHSQRSSGHRVQNERLL